MDWPLIPIIQISFLIRYSLYTHFASVCMLCHSATPGYYSTSRQVLSRLPIRPNTNTTGNLIAMMLFQNSRYHGTGTFISDDGVKYEGQWQNGNPHGRGALVNADGGTYDGDWVDGKRHGKGTWTFGEKGSRPRGWEWVQPGDKYEGNYVEGQLHGIGQWTHAKDGKTERIEASRGRNVGWLDRE